MDRKSTSVTVSLSQTNSNKMNNIYLRPTTVDDSAEISIFDAEKYFNELNVLEAPKPTTIGCGIRVSPAENIVGNGSRSAEETDRFSSASSSVADGYSSFYRNYRTRSFRSAATPTASSEASWNSQTGLLSVQPGSTMSVSLRKNLTVETDDKKKNRRVSDANNNNNTSPPLTPSSSSSTMRWLSLRKKCPCSCKKSVQINDKSQHRKQQQQHQQQQSENQNVHVLLPSHHLVPRQSTSISSSTTTSITSSSANDKVRHDSFQESWYRTHHHSLHTNNPRNTRSFSSDNIPTPLGLRTPKSNINAFSFPILNINSNKPKSPARDSLEIFRPKNSENAMVDGGVVIDDGASDASSDLFEIESFSTATTTTTTTTVTPPMARAVGSQGMFLYRRDSLEEGPSSSSTTNNNINTTTKVMSLGGHRRVVYEEEPMTPTTECCYEPSEASIDWSVTTAEGFDRASVAYAASEADFGDYTEKSQSQSQSRNRRKSSGVGGGLLTSCRCEKAVSVGQPVPRPAKPPLGPTGTMAMWAVSHKL